MSEPTSRTIDGLAPRSASNPDLSRLQRRNRPDNVPAAEPVSGRSAELSTTVAPTPASDPATSTDRITVYIDHALRLRARTAYRVTSHLEGDRTWSDFIERAILREVERREQAHNAGESYPGTNGPLAPGRSVT
jgi:hypothetical protein